MKKKVAIIGGGAAGFFCAANLSDAYEIFILEKTTKILTKVKISGGGRCNVTNEEEAIEFLIKGYPRGSSFLKKMFYVFGSKETKLWFEKRGVPLIKEEDGRVFPSSHSSQSIIDCLLNEFNIKNGQLFLNYQVDHISVLPNGQFDLSSQTKQSIIFDAIVIASGGYSKIDAYKWLQPLSHTIASPKPSLFSFILEDKELTKCAGISMTDVQIMVQNKTNTEGPILITHQGISGPAVLKSSAFNALYYYSVNYQFVIHINWLNMKFELLKPIILAFRKNNGKSFVINLNIRPIPKKLWKYICDRSNINDSMKWGDLPQKLEAQLCQNLLSMQLKVKAKATFKEEFVTAGGVDLADINHKTMESKHIPNAYFCGEVLNIDGITGGYNFQAAWTTSFIVAQALNAFSWKDLS